MVDIVTELTKLPPALKVWRTPVSDILYDSRLFQSNHAVALRWKSIIKALFDSDKTSFGELLSMFYMFYPQGAHFIEHFQVVLLLRHLPTSLSTVKTRCWSGL